MSDLLRSAMSARLAKLPQLPPLGPEDEDTDDNLGPLPGSGLGPPAVPFKTASRRKRTPNADFAPISAQGYFSDALQVAVPARQLDVRAYYTAPKFAEGTVMVCHHGAGYSGLSFACLAQEIVGQAKGECGVLAIDARRHGKTRSTAEKEDEDLSLDVLVQDFVEILRAVFPDSAQAPTLLLVGHSMGGAIVVRACPLLLEHKFRVSGVAALDVVEGFAIEALPHMNSILNARPDGFDSPEEAVEWHFTTNTIRNSRSARVSVPSIIVPAADEKTSPHSWVWRTPLRSTAPYWSGWFTGLSAAFLAARAARLLLLAGTDRLDRPLTIAQMQGKFQLEVVNGVGHMLHEDDPIQVASILLEFWRRNDRIRLPPKVKSVGEA
ncbi:Alpha/Beta hydrolase protein [Roridomyces roridus]|uniref:Protein phosphatase methylesterase 1 n=1 Tax=Roridomyces roridus TaxID=1738132 RepID=A0AAD7CBD2_9AGAR|nr:Alpha/Beta hydrolase protein [Roridomyces roridus]